MDIVRRAYLQIIAELDGDQDIIELTTKVREEVKRLIRLKAYSRKDWPKEFGLLPNELETRK